mmetsp:Transcript_44250/g.87309  ORF Transcript_44250/g.87309 Transcript_44250/m.87309 type:complete len:91 (-) Transcript_44250:897-1169(-)
MLTLKLHTSLLLLPVKERRLKNKTEEGKGSQLRENKERKIPTRFIRWTLPLSRSRLLPPLSNAFTLEVEMRMEIRFALSRRNEKVGVRVR